MRLARAKRQTSLIVLYKFCKGSFTREAGRRQCCQMLVQSGRIWKAHALHLTQYEKLMFTDKLTKGARTLCIVSLLKNTLSSCTRNIRPQADK